MKHYDMIVIGTGAANIVLEAAQQQGLRCAQIERGKFGGTCLTRGCIPTKVLVTAADRLYEMREAAALGLSAENISFDWIKLDKKFIEQSQDDFLIGGVIETLVGFAKRKNCSIVAEGVEDEITCNYVRGLGIGFGQGYYFGKPLSFEEYFNK